MDAPAPLTDTGRLREEILRRLPDLTVPELKSLDEFIDSLVDNAVTVSAAKPVMAKVACPPPPQ